MEYYRQVADFPVEVALSVFQPKKSDLLTVCSPGRKREMVKLERIRAVSENNSNEESQQNCKIEQDRIEFQVYVLHISVHVKPYESTTTVTQGN